MQLNVLCQSPVSTGMSPAQAVRNTVQLAQAADRLGYHRFWVAEHHSDAALASGAPEVLMGAVAAATDRIRVGSGGVQLLFYSPFKVAEQFNALTALHPGRIDLGVGRSGGSEGSAPSALGIRNQGARAFEAFDELLSWLGLGSARRPFADTWAMPRHDEPPEVWVLGTSPNSARFAAERGLPYAFGGFLDPRSLAPSLATYHQQFHPNASGQGPRVNVAWNVLAAETAEEAEHLARTTVHWFVHTMLRRSNPTFEDPDLLDDSDYSPMERAMAGVMRQVALVGTAEQVLDGLSALKKQTMADEFTLVTIPFDHHARVRSYELVAAAR